MKGSARNWNETKLAILKNPDAARSYIEGCLDEGVHLQTALRDVIKAQGYTCVAQKAHMARPYVIRALRPSANPMFETMKRPPRGVGLDFSVRPYKAPKKVQAAGGIPA